MFRRLELGEAEETGQMIGSRHVIRVIVWGDPVDVDVYRRSKTVWIARGEFKGRYHETKGASATQAAGLWREAARYHSG